jgi:hypothetical protein
VRDANEPVAERLQLQRELDEHKIRDYIEAVQRTKNLPIAYFAGFFTQSDSVTEILESVDPGARLAPIGPLPQETSVFGRSERRAGMLWRQFMPDEGRRVQLWPDELTPGRPPLRPDEAVRFIRRGEWLGRVERDTDDRFSATLWDREGPSSTERAEFFVAQLSAGDRHRLRPGAEFYWSVGYRENALGERVAASWIWLRRAPSEPPWELDPDIDAEAAAIVESFRLGGEE